MGGVSRGGRSRSGGGVALSWRDRLTRGGEGHTDRGYGHAPKSTHTSTQRGMGGRKGKIKDKRMIQNEAHSRQVTQTPAKTT